ncbi:MAG: hypothetical protein WBH47_16825 [Streptosporangiaceae bacterium]
MATESLGDESQPVLCLERLARLPGHMMQLVDALPQEWVGQHGLVDGVADETLRQMREVKVDNPLAEARGRGSAPVMRDLRGQQGNHLVQCTMLVAVQVIPDHPVIDDQ